MRQPRRNGCWWQGRWETVSSCVYGDTSLMEVDSRTGDSHAVGTTLADENKTLERAEPKGHFLGKSKVMNGEE